MKTIIVQWFKEEFDCAKAMRVLVSDHPDSPVGSRFDVSFFSLLAEEGYTIISLPLSKP